jgi:hypothetical protein
MQHPFPQSFRVLSLLEARVLGVLVEKERTVPDSYPLTLNALVAGCNQKSSRDPVLNAAETDVRAAVEGLKSTLLAIERSGERVARYAHNVERMMNVPQQAAALLAVLMLRGPQTAGELRMNCERLQWKLSSTNSPSVPTARWSRSFRANPARARTAGCIAARSFKPPAIRLRETPVIFATDELPASRRRAGSDGKP